MKVTQNIEIVGDGGGGIGGARADWLSITHGDKGVLVERDASIQAPLREGTR